MIGEDKPGDEPDPNYMAVSVSSSAGVVDSFTAKVNNIWQSINNYFWGPPEKKTLVCASMFGHGYVPIHAPIIDNIEKKIKEPPYWDILTKFMYIWSMAPLGRSNWFYNNPLSDAARINIAIKFSDIIDKMISSSSASASSASASSASVNFCNKGAFMSTSHEKITEMISNSQDLQSLKTQISTSGCDTNKLSELWELPACIEVIKFTGGETDTLTREYKATMIKLKLRSNSSFLNELKATMSTAPLPPPDPIKLNIEALRAVSGDLFDGYFIKFFNFCNDRPQIIKVRDGSVFNLIQFDHIMDIKQKFNLPLFTGKDEDPDPDITNLIGDIYTLITEWNEYNDDQKYLQVIIVRKPHGEVITQINSIIIYTMTSILEKFIDKIRKGEKYIRIFNGSDVLNFITSITGKISLYTFTTACRDINFRSRVDIKDKLDHNKQALDKITTLFSEITPTGTQLEVDEEEKVDKLEPDMLDVKNNLAIVKADINSSRPDCLNVMPMPSSIPNLLYANGVWDDNAIKIPKQPNFQNRAEDAIEIRNENRAKEMDKRRFSRNSTIGTGDMTTEGGSRHKSRRHLANNKTKVKNQIRSKMVRRKKTKKVVKRRQTRKAARNH